MPEFPKTDDQIAADERTAEEIRRGRERITGDLIHALFFNEFGSDEKQADAAAKALRTDFEYDGVSLRYITDPAKKESIPARECRSLLMERCPFFFQQPEAGSPFDPLARQALTSTNLTVRGQWIKQIGKEKADFVARDYGLRDAHDLRVGTPPDQQPLPDTNKKSSDPSSNPFLFGPPNTDSQGRFTSSAFERQAALVRQGRAEDAMRRAGVTRLGQTHAPRPA